MSPTLYFERYESSFPSEPKRGIFFVILSPQTEHTLSFSPSSVSVASFVVIHLPNVCLFLFATNSVCSQVAAYP